MAILFHGSKESLDRIADRVVENFADRIKHHRYRRDHKIKTGGQVPQALIVDDDVESIQPLQIVLKNFGFETTLAFDGHEAFEEIAKRSFDIVFLDICLPEMTGLEVLKEVESYQSHAQKYAKQGHILPVVTYSSYHMEDYGIPNGEKFFFAGHWQKPVSLADLTTLAGKTIDELGIFKRKE